MYNSVSRLPKGLCKNKIKVLYGPLSGLNLKCILIDYIMKTVSQGTNSPLETLVLSYCDLYCLRNKELNPLKSHSLGVG